MDLNISWKKKLIMYTLQGTNISHLGKRKIIFKSDFWWDMLVPWRVVFFPWCWTQILSHKRRGEYHYPLEQTRTLKVPGLKPPISTAGQPRNHAGMTTRRSSQFQYHSLPIKYDLSNKTAINKSDSAIGIAQKRCEPQIAKLKTDMDVFEANIQNKHI